MATPGGKRHSNGQLDGVSVAVAAVTLVAFLALLWASFAANDRMAANQGPSRMGVASDGSVWVNSHARLLHIARDGALLQSVALADLGLANPLSHVRVLADGRLIVGQAAPSGLFLCDVGAMRCERLIPGAPAVSRSPTTRVTGCFSSTWRVAGSSTPRSPAGSCTRTASPFFRTERCSFRTPTEGPWRGSRSVPTDSARRSRSTESIKGRCVPGAITRWSSRGRPTESGGCSSQKKGCGTPIS